MNKLGGSDFLGVTGMFLKVCELLLTIEVDRVFLEHQEGCGVKFDPSFIHGLLRTYYLLRGLLFSYSNE